MDQIIYQSVSLSCSTKQAFEMFSKNELLESWLTGVAEVEPIVGGRYELFWEPDDRENNSTIGCRITAIEPGQLLSFEWRSPKQFKHFANSADPLTHVVISFYPNESGSTVHLVHSGWRRSKEWEEARLWQDKAWQMAFKALSQQFQ